MKTVNERIQSRAAELSAIPFFNALKPRADLAKTFAFAEVLAPWALTFQDLLRINTSHTKDPEIRKILEQHAREDGGHDEWLLEDLDTLFGSSVRDVRWLYGRQFAGAREEALAIASEIFRIDDDRLRLVFVEALEAAAGEFFQRVERLARESGHDGRLKYFGNLHADAEEGHEMFEDEDRNEGILPESLREAALALVDRVFASFSRMAAVAHARLLEAEVA